MVIKQLKINCVKCSHLKYYNRTHDIPDLVFKSAYLFNINTANVCLFKVND